MFHVRTTKTASGATAIQVVQYRNRKTIVCSHIGSTHNPKEIDSLKQAALQWIERNTHQTSLFHSREKENTSVLVMEKSQYLGVRYSFIYEVLSTVFRFFDFHQLSNQLLLDLVLIRIIQPVSKLESLEYLSEMFGIVYKQGSIYQAITSFPELKTMVEKKTVAFAKKHLSFDFSIVFYDVTTLYFETFRDDEFRKPGFSKDNKSNQPQIVIGLIVTGEGFPVSYEVFEGSIFEGHTFIPVITKFKDMYAVKTLTVVADAAMISLDNVEQLVKNHLSYIVGARIANLTVKQIKEISQQLNQNDGFSCRVETDRGLLICDFSLKRYQKDKREMEKQIQKAERLLAENSGLKRTKFLKNARKTKQILNTVLIEKTKLLLGIKGYYTNLTDIDNKTIIDHYHNLWYIEHAFRIAKSDLATRPIYHFKKQTIEAHILICFMALAVCKYMELKTRKSTKKIVKLLKSITEARILNKLTGKEIIMRQELSEDVAELSKTLSMSY